MNRRLTSTRLSLLLSILASTAYADPATEVESRPPQERTTEPAAAREPPAPNPAAEDPGPSSFETNPSAIELQLGLGTPTGLIGVGFETSAAVPWMAWQVGAGLGMGGARLATALRPQLAFSSYAVGVGLGLSTGGAAKTGVMFMTTATIERAWWFEADLQLVIRTAHNASVRMTFGLSTLLNGEDCVTSGGAACDDVEGESGIMGHVPALGLGFGKAF